MEINLFESIKDLAFVSMFNIIYFTSIHQLTFDHGLSSTWFHSYLVKSVLLDFFIFVSKTPDVKEKMN